MITHRDWAGILRQAGRAFAARARQAGWGEFVTLAALFVCAGGILAFAGIVEETLEGDAESFDRFILQALRAPADLADPIGPAWLEAAFVDITALGGYTVLTLFALATLGYLAILRRWRTAALVATSLIGGAVLNMALKGLFARPRPDLVSHLVETSSASLPSGHAMISAITYLTLGALLARVQPRRRLKIYITAISLTLTLLIGFSRVYLGVHWPTDVLAGWSIGAAWAMGFWLLAQVVVREG